MGIVQNIMGIVRDVNERKENARIKDVLRNNLNDPEMGLREIMQINPIKGMDFQQRMVEQAMAEEKARRERQDAVINRLGVATQYLRGVPLEKRQEVMEAYAPLFHELIGPDNYSAFMKAALSDPDYLASVDDNTFRDMFKRDNEYRTVTPGSVVLQGGKPIFRNPHKMSSVTIGGNAVSRVFDPNTGTYLDEDDSAEIIDVPTPDAAPQFAPGRGTPLTVDILRPAIVAQESGGDYTAVNKTTGALGAYQIMPATGKALAQRLGLPWRPDMMVRNDPASVRYQDAIGTAAITEAIEASGGDPRIAAMYYHGGSDRNKWGPRTIKYGEDLLNRLSGGQNTGQAAPRPVLGRRTTINPKAVTPATSARILSNEEATALGFEPGTVVQYDGKSYRVLQRPAKQTATSAKAQELKAQREQAQRTLNSTLGSLANNYVQLFKMGSITSSSRSPAQNIRASIEASTPGQLIGGVLGTESQTLRQTIKNATPIVMNTIRQAAQMGVRGMDSNKELEFYTQAVGDPTKPIEANLAALVVLDMAYGSQTAEAILRQLPPELRPRVKKQIGIIMQRDQIRFGKPGEGLFKDQTGGLQRLGTSAATSTSKVPIGTIIRNPRTGQRKRKTASGWEDIP